MGRGFIELVESGRIADEAGLRRAFRAAAKRVHPDARVGAEGGAAAPDNALGDTEKAFIALRADYEAALAYLRGELQPAAGGEPAADRREPRPKPRPIKPLVFSRDAFYESLNDLLGRGFPRRPKAPYPRSCYDASRERLLAYLAGRDQVYPEDRALTAFLALEAGYAAIYPKGSGWLSVDNDPARSLYFLLTNVVLYHEMGFAHLAAYTRNAFPLAESLLRSRGETRPLAFLSILVADLAAGPACVA